MPEQLGKIEKLEAERFKHGKKLYFVPLIYSHKDSPDEYKEKCTRYWQQVTEQLTHLVLKIGTVNRVYHESIFQAGQDGIRATERLNPSSYQIVKNHCNNGATFEAIEEKELLEEVMDWQRCLMFGFISDKVANKVSEFYIEAMKKRNEFMAKRISETLKDDEAGLLFIKEGHSVQFPADIEVFSVFPPVLDEIHRWQRDQDILEREKLAHTSKEKPARKTREGKQGTGKRTKRKPEY